MSSVYLIKTVVDSASAAFAYAERARAERIRDGVFALVGIKKARRVAGRPVAKPPAASETETRRARRIAAVANRLITVRP